MPTFHNILECAIHILWFGDVNARRMFLNYPLDRYITPFVGVNVSWIEYVEEAGGICGGGRKWDI